MSGVGGRCASGERCLDFSQRAAAEKLQMSVWRFWRLERGVCEPNPEEEHRIRRLLDTAFQQHLGE